MPEPTDRETYEVEDFDPRLCEVCGEPFDARGSDLRLCMGCDDFADCEPFMF